MTTIVESTLRTTRPDPLEKPTPRPPDHAGHPTDARVYVQKVAFGDEYVPSAHNLDFDVIHYGRDGEDDTASLIAELDASKLADDSRGTPKLGSGHFTHVLEELDPSKRVRIGIPLGATGVHWLFDGYPMASTVQWSSRGQQVTATALSAGQETLRRWRHDLLGGQVRRANEIAAHDPTSPDLWLCDLLPIHFNPEGRPNRLETPLTLQRFNQFDGNLLDEPIERVPVFTDAGNRYARYWTYAAALRYVLTFGVSFLAPDVPVDASEPLTATLAIADIEGGSEGLDPFIRRMTQKVDDLVIPPTDAETAILAVCQAAGVHVTMRVSTVNGQPVHTLHVYAPPMTEQEEDASRNTAGAPVVRDIPRDAPFSDYTEITPADVRERGAAVAATLTHDRRAVTRPQFVAGRYLYEATLLLRPGWRSRPEHHLDDLDLTEEEIEAYQQQHNGESPDPDMKRDEALTFWENQLHKAFEFVDQDHRLPKSVYHGQHPNHAQVAQVGRRWVFPDTYDYYDAEQQSSPFARATGPWADPELFNPMILRTVNNYDRMVPVYADNLIGGAIETGTLLFPRRRAFLDTIGTLDDATGDRTPTVWINYVATDPRTALLDPNWVRFTGQLKFDPDRAAVYITDDNLAYSPHLLTDPGNPEGMSMVRALIGWQDDGSWGVPHFFLAVTCGVSSDVRLRSEPIDSGLSSRRRYRTVDLGYDRYTVRKRRTQRSFYDSLPVSSDPNYEGRNDADRLDADGVVMARRMAAEHVAGSFEMPFIDTTRKVGDSYSGVSGLGIAFGSYPSVVAVEHTKAAKAGLRTVVHLEDLRDAPEVGSE